MNKEKIGHIEKLLGRELSEEEQERLARIQDILGIADNDALWDSYCFGVPTDFL